MCLFSTIMLSYRDAVRDANIQNNAVVTGLVFIELEDFGWEDGTYYDYSHNTDVDDSPEIKETTAVSLSPIFFRESVKRNFQRDSRALYQSMLGLSLD